MKRGKPLERSKPMRRGKRLQAKRWGIAYRPPRRLARRAHLKPYLDFVATLPCIECGALDGTIVACHMTLSLDEKGAGWKVDDRQTVPLCYACHAYWDGRRRDRRNPFAGMDADERFARGRAWVETTQKLAYPDEWDEAVQFELLGIGRIEKTATGWFWYSVLDEPAASASSHVGP